MKSRTPALQDLNDLKGTLPTSTVPDNIAADVVTQAAITQLNRRTHEDLEDHVIWRDFLALTGSYRTTYSRGIVSGLLDKACAAHSVDAFLASDHPPRKEHSLDDSSWYDIDFTFKASHGRLEGICAGTVSVSFGSDGKWHIWMIRTWLESFEGHGSPDILPPRADFGKEEITTGNGEAIYDAIIVGGGQGGLCTAGRLQALGLSYVVLERFPAAGDIWKNRYSSLTWHTIKEYGELPFGRSFGPDEPVLIPAKRIGKAHNDWVSKHKINIHTNCLVETATWDDSTELWSVVVNKSNGRTSYRTYSSKNLIFAMGGGSTTEHRPSWALPNEVARSGYTGTILHSKDYQDCKAWTGKHGIVVGTANTAHDVAEDMADAGMTVTMVQRSPTFIMPAEWLHASMQVHYNDTKDTETADREAFTYPIAITRQMINRGVLWATKTFPERFDALERAGFMVDRHGDITENLYVRLGGHYVDTGASARIAKGEIKMKTAAVGSLSKHGLAFDDGTEVEADLIVLCTGFNHNFREDIRKIIGPVEAQVDDYLGLDASGEIRGHARPAGHPHMYYHGGDVRAARWFSRFIALRLQAEKLGYPIESVS